VILAKPEAIEQVNLNATYVLQVSLMISNKSSVKVILIFNLKKPVKTPV
jgi:hypothetical protein